MKHGPKKSAWQRKRAVRLAAKFAETGRKPLRVVTTWPRKRVVA